METCTLALSLLRTAAPDIMIPKIEDNTICSLWSVHYADYESDRLADWSRLHQETPSISIECPVRHLKTMDLDVCKQWHLAAKLFQTSKIIAHFIQKERTVFMVYSSASPLLCDAPLQMFVPDNKKRPSRHFQTGRAYICISAIGLRQSIAIN